MKGRNVISAVMKKFKVSTDRELAQKLGITTQAVKNWKNRETVTDRQLAGLIHGAGRAGAGELQENAIRPLVEFFRIDRCETKQGTKYELFGIKAEDGNEHPYREGLRKELENHHGIYIFFDSRGRAIYVGKARQQKLWKEMNLPFNRERGEVQKIKRVSHPTRKQHYRTSDEKARQITDHLVPLHELASYFSAYQIGEL